MAEKDNPVRSDSALICGSSTAIKTIFSYFPEVHTILDPTYGRGTFYAECPHLEVTGGDINPDLAKDRVMDYRDLPYPDRSFDAVVIDPPFQQGGHNGMFEDSYSVSGRSMRDMLVDYTVGIYEGLRVARVLVVAKCADMVESGRFVPFHAQLIQAVNYQLWDMLISVRKGSPTHPAWKTVQHFRHNYSVYLIWKV